MSSPNRLTSSPTWSGEPRSDLCLGVPPREWLREGDMGPSSSSPHIPAFSIGQNGCWPLSGLDPGHSSSWQQRPFPHWSSFVQPKDWNRAQCYPRRTRLVPFLTLDASGGFRDFPGRFFCLWRFRQVTGSLSFPVSTTCTGSRRSRRARRRRRGWWRRCGPWT